MVETVGKRDSLMMVREAGWLEPELGENGRRCGKMWEGLSGQGEPSENGGDTGGLCNGISLRGGGITVTFDERHNFVGCRSYSGGGRQSSALESGAGGGVCRGWRPTAVQPGGYLCGSLRARPEWPRLYSPG